MSASWIPFIFGTLQAHAYKLGQYVAAGSWCEITHQQKVDVEHNRNSTDSTITSCILVDVALTNLDQARFGTGRFLLPSEAPLLQTSRYRATYKEELDYFEVYPRQPLLRFYEDQVQGLLVKTVAEHVSDKKDSSLSEVTTRISITTLKCVTAPLAIIATTKATKETTDISVYAFASPPISAPSINPSSTAISALPNKCSNSSIVANQYYQSPTGFDWASTVDDEGEDDNSTVPTYYHSPTGEDWAVLDEESDTECMTETASEVRSSLSPNDETSTSSSAAGLSINKTSGELLVCLTSLEDMDTKVSEHSIAIPNGDIIAFGIRPCLLNLHRFVPQDTSADFKAQFAEVEAVAPDMKTAAKFAQGIVDWRYMCEASRRLIDSGGSHRPYLEEANRSMDWFWTIANEVRPEAIDYLGLPGPHGMEQTSPIQEPTQLVHHMNFQSEPVYYKSNTPPATSFWLISSTEVADRLDWNGSLKRTLLSYMAAKWVDPIVFHGDDNNIPEGLIGTALQEYVTGMVEKVYVPYGLWQQEHLELDEDHPRSSEGIDCLYYRCSQVNQLPRLPINLIADEVALINDDGRVHLPMPSRKRLPVGKRSKLSIVYNGFEHPDTSIEAEMLPELPLLCPVPIRPHRRSLVMQPTCAFESSTETLHDLLAPPTHIEDPYTIPPDACPELFTETKLEVCFNKLTLVLETIIEEQPECDYKSSPTETQTRYTTEVLSNRFIEKFSEVDEAVDLLFCAVEPTSDEGDERFLSDISEQTEERLEDKDTIFSSVDVQHVLNLEKNVTREPSADAAPKASTIAVENISGERVDDKVKSIDSMLQLSFTAVFTGAGLIRPSKPQDLAIKTIIDECSQVKMNPKPEVVQERLPTSKLSKLVSAHVSTLANDDPELTDLEQAIEKSSVICPSFFIDQDSPELHTTLHHDILDDDLWSSSLAIATLKEDTRYGALLSIEDQVDHTKKSGKESAIARDNQAQLSTRDENSSAIDYSYITWEDKESSSGSLTDSEHKSSSSLPDTTSDDSSTDSSRPQTIHRVSVDDALMTDDTVTQAGICAVRISNKRKTILFKSAPSMRQPTTNRALDEPHLESYDEDRDFDYQSDEEVEDPDADFEDFWSSEDEAESDEVAHLREPLCDDFFDHDAPNVKFYLKKLPVEVSSPSNETFSGTNYAEQVSTEEALKASPTNNVSAQGSASTQAHASQGASNCGKEFSMNVTTRTQTTASPFSVEELAVITEKEPVERSADYLDMIQHPPEDQTGKACTTHIRDKICSTDSLTAFMPEELVQEAATTPTAFDFDVGLTIPRLLDYLLYGSVVGYLGYRIFTAFKH
ncbi:hypothetical protein MMC27_006520 [Xylographa pallens]|nr:hypothetical protein [Xylographa pallens]